MVVLLARVCVGMRLVACVLVPSDDVGLGLVVVVVVVVDGPGLVVDAEGGYRADSFLGGSVCLEDEPSPLEFVLDPCGALALPFEAVAMETLRV